MKTLLALGGGLALLMSGLGAPTAYAVIDLGLDVQSQMGPDSLPAGLSGTYRIGVGNVGDEASSAELLILFAGKLEQTGQIRTEGGFECQVVPPSAGINSAVRCTTQRMDSYTFPTITVQARGTAPGTGQLVVTIDPSHSVPETFFDNNFRQKDVAIT